MDFQLSYFNPKRWCCESATLNMPANLENSAVATGLEKVNFHSNLKEGKAKECSNYHTIALISHTSNVQNSPSQASSVHEPWTSRCSSWISKRQNNQRSNCQHPLDYWKSRRVLEKTSISALLTMPKPLTVWITINCRKFWKRKEYQTTWPASWEICMQVRKQQLELDMEQQTGSK